jgi:outer membrane receptor protein involved in Fe transport
MKSTLVTFLTLRVLFIRNLFVWAKWLASITTGRICHNLGYGYIGARNDTTQQSGQTPDKEAEIKNIPVYVSGYTETSPTECYLSRLSGVNKVSLFRADSLARYLLQCA